MPAAPTLGGALRAAASDFYFNSWRLVPSNVLWGLGFGILYLVWLVFWPAALLLAPLLAFPTLGIFRIAALITRAEEVSFRDGIAAWRGLFVPTLTAGTMVVTGTLVLLANLVDGVTGGTLFGWAFATLAAWGLAFGWLWLLCFWPLLSDPRRPAWGFRRAGRLAAYLVIAHPMRLASLGIALAILLLASTVAFAALVTVSLGYAALLACRYVLPAADRLEVRLAHAGVRLGPEVPAEPLDPVAEAAGGRAVVA